MKVTTLDNNEVCDQGTIVKVKLKEIKGNTLHWMESYQAQRKVLVAAGAEVGAEVPYCCCPSSTNLELLNPSLPPLCQIMNEPMSMWSMIWITVGVSYVCTTQIPDNDHPPSLCIQDNHHHRSLTINILRWGKDHGDQWFNGWGSSWLTSSFPKTFTPIKRFMSGMWCNNIHLPGFLQLQKHTKFNTHPEQSRNKKLQMLVYKLLD